MTTEVAGNPLVGHTVLSARRYESGPPANETLDVVSTCCMFRQLFLYFEHGNVNSLPGCGNEISNFSEGRIVVPFVCVFVEEMC